MRLSNRMIHFATTHAAAALAALFLVAAPAAAQTLIEIPAETASARAGRWVVTTDSTASGGGGRCVIPTRAPRRSRPRSPARPTISRSRSAPYAGVPYKLVMLGKADRNYWGNDSVFVQFSGSVSSSGSSKWRIGTTSATEVNLEDCSGCGLSGWKWQDNGYGTSVVAERVYFATTGTQRMRIQTREDGLSVDHIQLIPEAATAPATATPQPRRRRRPSRCSTGIRTTASAPTAGSDITASFPTSSTAAPTSSR